VASIGNTSILKDNKMALYYNVNNTPATGAEAIANIGFVLSSSGWTIISSSDGSSYGAGETYFSTSSLAATNAWYIVQEPTGVGGREWCFQRTNANNNWRIKVSPNAGFSGGTPSATQVPLATDEGVIWGSGTDASPSGQLLFFEDSSFKFHIVAESTPVGPVGNEVYGWWAFANVVGSFQPVNTYVFLCQEPLASGSYPALVGTRTSTTSGDADPCVYGCNSIRWYSTYYNFVFTTQYFLNGYSSDDQLYYNFKYFYDYQSSAGTLTYGQEIMVGGNGNDYGVRGLSASPDGKDIALPYHIGRQGTGANSSYFAIKTTEIGFKGRLNFLRLKGANRSNGVTTTIVGGASSTYVVLGDLLMPWPDGIAPIF
jgi:hypothetical protein